MSKKYVNPAYKLEIFNCPHCQVLAQMNWNFYKHPDISSYIGGVAKCQICGDFSIWAEKKEQMLYPKAIINKMPHEDMPEDIRADYMEAKEIEHLSPRGTCALLRLAIAKLCHDIVPGDQSLCKKLPHLIKKGLPEQIRTIFEVVRLTENQSTNNVNIINLQDNAKMAAALFELLNLVVEKLISEPQKISNLCSQMSSDKVTMPLK